MKSYWELRFLLEHRLCRRFGFPRVTVGPEHAGKRALLAYLSLGMRWREDDPRLGWHQNYRQSLQIAHVLAERGYRVEVVQYDDPHFVPDGRYDLAVIHPGPVSRRLQNLPMTGFRLCLRTGRHGSFVDRVVAERYAMLNARRGTALAWAGTGETEEVHRGFDAVACFDGDGRTAATFEAAGLKTIPFRNYANPGLEFIGNKEAGAQNRFVYIAGHLHVSKGLDWLIEDFADNPDRELFICGKIPDELRAVYAEELERPNIHTLGFVQLTSPRFRAVCRKAAWYVSPSATEGCAGSALDAMASGLIPILSDACGVASHGVGKTLRPCTRKSLDMALGEAVGSDLAEVAGMARDSRKVVEQYYLPQHFQDDWNTIIDCIEEGTPR